MQLNKSDTIFHALLWKLFPSVGRLSLLRYDRAANLQFRANEYINNSGRSSVGQMPYFETLASVQTFQHSLAAKAFFFRSACFGTGDVTIVAGENFHPFNYIHLSQAYIEARMSRNCFRTCDLDSYKITTQTHIPYERIPA